MTLVLDPALATVIGAGLTLSGVVLGLLIGHRRWSTERRDQRGKLYVDERTNAYRGAWKALRGVEENCGTNGHNDLAAYESITDLNSFLDNVAPYMDGEDEDHFRTYCRRFKNFHRPDDGEPKLEGKLRFEVIDLLAMERELIKRRVRAVAKGEL